MGYLEKHDWLTKEEAMYKDVYTNPDGSHNHFDYIRDNLIEAAAHIDGVHNQDDRGDSVYYSIAEKFIESYGLDNLKEDIMKHRASSDNYWLSKKAYKELDSSMHPKKTISHSSPVPSSTLTPTPTPTSASTSTKQSIDEMVLEAEDIKETTETTEKDPETIYQEFRENETDGTYLDFAHEYVANNSDFEHWVYSEYSEALGQAENGNCPDYLDGYLIIDEDGAHFNLYPDDIVDEFIQREFSIKALQNLDSDKPHYTGFEKYVAENYVPENKEKDEEER